MLEYICKSVTETPSLLKERHFKTSKKNTQQVSIFLKGKLWANILEKRKKINGENVFFNSNKG